MIHRGLSRREESGAKRVRMRAEMDLPDPERISRVYPHQLSGGQQQRAVIAMALWRNHVCCVG